MTDLNDQSPVPGGTTAIRGGKYVREERAPGPVVPPMTDTERLAALLKELDPLAVSMDDLAARLVAVGVRVGIDATCRDEGCQLQAQTLAYLAGPRIDPDRLARALRRLDFSAWGSQYDAPEEFLAAAAAAIAKAYEEEG